MSSSWRRFEVLLPLKLNDGQPVPRKVLGEAVEGAKSINDDKIADYLRSHEFNTIMASGIRFGKNGEWTKSGMMQVQYHDLTDAANLDTWRGMSYQTVLTPCDEKTGGPSSMAV